jgi:hypothetical protein
MTARAYLAICSAIAIAGLALIAALGLIVDAYGVFGTRLLPASRFPPDLRLMEHWDRVAKAIELARRRGDQVLFVGDSRTQHGLDPAAPALAGVKGYNAALPGATLAEQMGVISYALQHESTIKHIVWSQSLETFPLGFFDLTDYRDSAFAGRPIFPALLRDLFGSDRVLTSWKTLLQAMRRQVPGPMTRNGVVVYNRDPVEGPGIAKTFDTELIGKYHEMSGPMSREALEQAYKELARRLRELKAAGIDVDLVIVPVHIWRLEFFRQIGVETQSDGWKRQLATTVQELAGSAGTGKLRLFDFATPHYLVEQAVFAPPPPGERRYYLESNHFYPWLGDKVLARLFSKGEEPEATPATEPFGQEIGQGADSMSIDNDIATARAALDSWESNHQDDVNHIRAITSH